MSAADHLLDGLTDVQRDAVQHVDGPMLVLAGPGSGKTTVVTRRVAWLVHQGVPAWQILALTFTNKAAGEMRGRVEGLLPGGPGDHRGLTVSTFHSFCVRLLRRYGEAAGIPPRFSVYDAADQKDAMKQAIARADLDTKNWTVASVASTISNAKNRLLDADAFAGEASDFYHRTIGRIYRHYRAILRESDALDFDDLLLHAANLLRHHDGVRAELQDRYRYLLIDEYQDTNHAQFVLAHTLAAGHRNIAVVGDPDQAIYGWRGADIRNILEFEAHYPEARVVPLGRNFRSTGHIVDAAAGLIAHNERRKPKDLSTDLGIGERIVVAACADEAHEARHIVETFQRRHDDDGVPWREMAVLYRINALSRVLEDAFRRASVPYVIARGTAFFARKEVKDALAYLRLIVNPADRVSLLRVVNEPTRGIGRTSLQRLEAHAAARGLAPIEALRHAKSVPDVSSRAANAAERFVAMLDGLRRRAAAPIAPGEGGEALRTLVDATIRESGLEDHYRKGRSEEDAERLENLVELVSAAAGFEPPDDADGPGAEPATGLDRLAAFLESVALVSDADAIDPEGGAVTLMTLHTAKGLEYDVVAVAGLEEGLLPHSRAASDDAECEEERRLCFVGMTRARRHLLMTRARTRTIRGLRERTIPSRFLDELPHAAVDRREPWEDAALDDGFRDDVDGGAGGFSVGAIVRHRTFGIGRIESLMPRPVGSAARIDFGGGRVRTLIIEYAGLEPVEGDASA